jgi:hypothetical protein
MMANLPCRFSFGKRNWRQAVSPPSNETLIYFPNNLVPTLRLNPELGHDGISMQNAKSCAASRGSKSSAAVSMLWSLVVCRSATRLFHLCCCYKTSGAIERHAADPGTFI